MTAQRHKYEYKVNPDTAAAKVIRMVGADKRVLELGPGPGSITRHLHENGCRVTALELDEKAIEIVSAFCEQVHPCNLNDAEWPALLADADKFSAIVAADVLEHLYDPWTTLQKMQPFLAEDGYVVISLPHVAHNAVVACLLNEDFEYQPWGLLDKTHIRFWGMKNIQKLFEEAGFKIIEADFVVRSPEQTEFASRWRKLPAKTRQALACNPFGNVYQVVVRAVPQTAAGNGLRLESQLVPSPAAGAFSAGARGSRVLGFFISFLSLTTRARISRLLQRLGIPH
ncbi:MAG: class I SAM-dependent methyltransferase [Rhodocyclales bacterium]|nr:class I SAM-dependent methyltransferase [Rhodocyclales bacterium]